MTDANCVVSPKFILESENIGFVYSLNINPLSTEDLNVVKGAFNFPPNLSELVHYKPKTFGFLNLTLLDLLLITTEQHFRLIMVIRTHLLYLNKTADTTDTGQSPHT